jgi:peptidoglycan/xylan/chitin deacetylase (PgdA/CDA1 family)
LVERPLILALIALALITLALILLALIVLLPSLVIRTLLAPLNPAVVFCGGGRQRRLALTIDDGPSGTGSQALLELLRELEVPATFFLIGSHLPNDPHFPRRALEQGHAIGNHLWRDVRSAGLDQAAFLGQLGDTEAAVERAAAPQTLRWRWCRPGRGWFHAAMLGWLAERGYRLVLGSIFPWDTYQPPLWFVQAFVRLNAHPGGILVLHDRPELNPRTQASLRWIVPALRRRGYSFVPLAELLEAAG